VYVPPQNSTYYYVLNPSSYEVIEMGVTGVSDLPLDNQFLFDGQRWRLTTARTQFFGNEGEYIMNEEGEAYNFPFQGVVLKYLSSGSFRFVLVSPTGKPLTSTGRYMKPDLLPVKPAASTDALQAQFDKARAAFEKKQYKAALALFRPVVADSKDQLLRMRALYWMGESYFGMRQYGNAKAMFVRVTKETDLASLVGPAKSMIARCNKRLGVK
jgi:tetratricopeptide (TPR) repeat protein